MTMEVVKKSKATKSEPVIYKSEGQRLLCEQPGTLAGIAERLGCTKQAVSLWRLGEQSPATKQRERLKACFGIEPIAWERLPAGAMPPQSTDADPDDVPDDDEESDDDEPSLEEDYKRQLRALRKAIDTPGILARERLALNDAFGKALERRRRYELQIELQEDRIVRGHPAWRRLKRLIMDALATHPAAARDVGRALQMAMGDGEEE